MNHDKYGKRFICVIHSSVESEEEMLDRLEKEAKTNPLHQDALLMKVKSQRDKFAVIKNPDEFRKLIDIVGILLIEIEAQLQHQDGKLLRLNLTFDKHFNVIFFL